MSVVIATAGHVDHGKSTLVRALTGMDPDRLESERRRALTIELGFAWADFAGTSVAFVDVPGHERFISTMLAGVGALPLALLVVAADDPWMPQAAEHLAALDALGVRRGIVAVTRSDLADPGPATARAREEIGRTSLAGAPVLAVSAATGEGLGPLREAISRLAAGAPIAPARTDVRLWVDRRFTIDGAGTVVTGTLPAGTVRVGDEFSTPGGEVRVRGIESLGEAREEVRGSARVALNLTGETEHLGRGDALWVAGHWWPSTRVDVRLTGEQTPPPRTPMWHIGAHAEQVGLRMIDERHAQLTFTSPLPLRQGDRAILRDPGDRRLWGAVVLDPDAAQIRGAGAREARSRVLDDRGGAPDYSAELAARGIVEGATLRALGITAAGVSGAWHMSSEWRARTAERIGALVRQHDEEHPADPGLAPAEIRRALDLPGRVEGSVITGLLPPGLRVEAGRVTSRAVELPARVERALGILAAEHAGETFGAPSSERLRELGLTENDLGAAARLKRIFLPAPGVVLPPSAPTRAVELLRELPGPFTVSQARRALGTTRRVTIPVLEFLDRAGVTRRTADDRREMR